MSYELLVNSAETDLLQIQKPAVIILGDVEHNDDAISALQAEFTQFKCKQSITLHDPLVFFY